MHRRSTPVKPGQMRMFHVEHFPGPIQTSTGPPWEFLEGGIPHPSLTSCDQLSPANRAGGPGGPIPLRAGRMERDSGGFWSMGIGGGGGLGGGQGGTSRLMCIMTNAEPCQIMGLRIHLSNRVASRTSPAMIGGSGKPRARARAHEREAFILPAGPPV